MIYNLIWIFLLILQCGIVTPRSLNARPRGEGAKQQYDYEAQNRPKDESEEQVISVRITSSVAVGRGGPQTHLTNNDSQIINEEVIHQNVNTHVVDHKEIETITTEIPPNLIGANIEYIRQLNAKKEAKSLLSLDKSLSSLPNKTRMFEGTIITVPEEEKFLKVDTNDAKEVIQEIKSYSQTQQSYNNPEEPHYDSIAEPSMKRFSSDSDKINEYKNQNEVSLVTSIPPLSFSHLSRINDSLLNITHNTNDLRNITNNTEDYNSDNALQYDDTIAASSVQTISTLTAEIDENIENVPLARSVSFSPGSKNYIRDLHNKSPNERGNNPSLTTVTFNIVHDSPKQPTDYSIDKSGSSNLNIGSLHTFYEPLKVYSEPAKIYSEPAKVYSEPAKIYSEPAKIYSEPAKVYSEPAKIYSEPAKFYSQPASLHLSHEVIPKLTTWPPTPLTDTKIITSTPTTVFTLSTELSSPQTVIHQQPEKNYEVDEKASIQTDGRSHGIQESTTEKCKDDNCKVGYVVEGRQYKKYRVEERTPDGFIVGEYGVVRNEDGALRGVRYTADSAASPRLIYEALMKFLQLK